LTALESGSTDVVNNIEQQRTQDLERRLTESLSSKAALQQKIAQLEGDLEHHSVSRSSAEDRSSSALTRAEAAESSYSRSLVEFAQLHQQVSNHEATHQTQLEQLASLTSTNQQFTADNAHLKERATTSDATIINYLATLEQAQLALIAANARADQNHAIWESSQEELTKQQARAQQLQSDLDTKHLEFESASTKAVDLEKMLKATREEHDATSVLAAGGLAEVIAAHRAVMSRDAAPNELHEARIKAVEEEAATFKKMHLETRSRGEESMAALNESRGREVQLQTQLLALRSEIATLRNNHSHALAEVGRHQSIAATRDVHLRDASRVTETAELKASLLRSLMSEHGLAVDDDDIATRSAPFNGSEKPEELHRRVVELEGQLDQRIRQHQDLESAHEDAQHDLDDAEEKLRESKEATRITEQKSEQMSLEIERLKVSAKDLDGQHQQRVSAAAEELSVLQLKHSNLETTHSKAVQYVKGTEKMLRRMKVIFYLFHHSCPAVRQY
jgi:hypothetical protein